MDYIGIVLVELGESFKLFETPPFTAQKGDVISASVEGVELLFVVKSAINVNRDSNEYKFAKACNGGFLDYIRGLWKKEDIS